MPISPGNRRRVVAGERQRAVRCGFFAHRTVYGWSDLTVFIWAACAAGGRWGLLGAAPPLRGPLCTPPPGSPRGVFLTSSLPLSTHQGFCCFCQFARAARLLLRELPSLRSGDLPPRRAMPSFRLRVVPPRSRRIFVPCCNRNKRLEGWGRAIFLKWSLPHSVFQMRIKVLQMPSACCNGGKKSPRSRVPLLFAGAFLARTLHKFRHGASGPRRRWPRIHISAPANQGVSHASRHV